MPATTRRRAVHLIDDAILAAESAVSAGDDDFADDIYGDPEDHAFEAVGGLHDEHAEREVRHILARVFGM
jgi:hypothetical protein